MDDRTKRQPEPKSKFKPLSDWLFFGGLLLMVLVFLSAVTLVFYLATG